jgi:hypothetical protein
MESNELVQLGDILLSWALLQQHVKVFVLLDTIVLKIQHQARNFLYLLVDTEKREWKLSEVPGSA